MNHSLSRKGYVFLYLYLYLYIAVSMGLNIFVSLLSKAGLVIPFEIIIALKAIIFIALPIVCANRFLEIENRAPTTGESYFISMLSFLAVFLLMLLATGILIAGDSQNKDIDIAIAANERLLGLVILSGVCYFGLYLSFGIIAKIRSREHSYS